MKCKYAFLTSFLTFALILGVKVSFAQQPTIGFKHLNYKDGLVQSPIATMLQDRDGYIWIGNLAGLSRYDGNEFKNFRHQDSDPFGLTHNRVNKIYEDKGGRLWIATGGGLNLYEKNTEHFFRIGIPKGKGGENYVTAVQQDSYGRIWASTFKGVKLADTKSRKLIAFDAWKKAGEDDLYEGIILSLFEDRQKTFWVGMKQGLKRIDMKDGRVLPLPEVIKQNKELANAKVIVVKQDRQGDIWFGTEENGIFRYSEKNNQCLQYNENTSPALPSDWINDILVKDNEVWAATRNGTIIFNLQQNTITRCNHDNSDPTSLNDDSDWALMQDRTNNVWVGTYSGGINLYSPGNANFSNIGERIGNHFGLNVPLGEAIVEDKDGKLWVGTLGGGLNHLDLKANAAKSYSISGLKSNKLSNDIKSLAMDSTGKLWVGTIDGLCKFDPASKAVTPISLHLLYKKTSGRFINALLPDKEGIWVGTNGAGLKLVSYAGVELMTISKTDKKDPLSDNYINALASIGDDLWVGTQDGVDRYNKKTHQITIYRRSKENPLGTNNIFCFLKDRKNHLWIGADGGGVCYFDELTGHIYAIKQNDGLADDVVVSIVQDKDDDIWVSTNNGISHIRLQQNKVPTPGNYSVENFTSANGLSSNQFLINSAICTRDGELLFGGMNGITTFYPQKIVKNLQKPEILLSNLLINNKEATFGKEGEIAAPINELSDLALPYNKNNITIKFSALSFISPERNNYAYKMQGLANYDKWQGIGNKNEVNFINLEPGQYTFNIKASNNDGVWNDIGRSIKITILPPFWKTWWAYLAYLTVISFGLYKVVQFFQIRARLERDLYNEHLENERQQEFYKMKLDFFTNISHELRTPLTLILSPIENLHKKTQGDPQLNKQVSQVKNNAERLFRLIGELMDFRKAETGNMVLYLQKNNIVPFLKEIYLSFAPLAESRNIQYDFVSAADEILLYSDNDQLEKVFFNLLSNAFKFTSDNGTIKLEISQTDTQHLTITVKDNGKGIPEEYQQKLFTNFYQVNPDKSQPGTGVGLALSKGIIELHNGTISVKSKSSAKAKSAETVFTVMLPYQNSVSGNVHLVAEEPNYENVNSYLLQSEIDVITDDVSNSGSIRYTILIVEDNEELRTFIAESLSGYDVITCVNGYEAFEQAIIKIPDLIVSDVMMPVMSGLELCRKIKTDERTSHIPVILLTALAAHIHQVNGLQTGADLYLTKPFSTRILSLNVHNLLSSRDLMRKKFAGQIPRQTHTSNINSADDKFMKKLLKIIDEHMENPEFGVGALGSEIGMSKTVLYKKITALTDMSPLNFLKSVRLQKAALLLQQNELTVNEISSLVGFNDRKYFSREFKKQYGKKPSEMSE